MRGRAAAPYLSRFRWEFRWLSGRGFSGVHPATPATHHGCSTAATRSSSRSCGSARPPSTVSTGARFRAWSSPPPRRSLRGTHARENALAGAHQPLDHLDACEISATRAAHTQPRKRAQPQHPDLPLCRIRDMCFNALDASSRPPNTQPPG